MRRGGGLCGVCRPLRRDSLCLLRGDWAGAFAANPFLLVTSPLLAAILWRFWWKDTRPGKAWQVTAVVYIAALLIWGIARNFCGL